jgi:hypothetical protein
LDQSVVAGQGCVAGTDASRVSSEVLRCLFRPYRWQASSHSELQYDRETCGSWLASDSNLEATKNPQTITCLRVFHFRLALRSRRVYAATPAPA